MGITTVGDIIRKNIFCSILTIFFILIYSSNAIAKFIGPDIILSLNYGIGDGYVGIEYGDSDTRFPWKFSVSHSGRIAINDDVNNRIIFFENGKLIKTIDMSIKNLMFDYDDSLYVDSYFVKIDKNFNIGKQHDFGFKYIVLFKNNYVAIDKSFNKKSDIQLYDNNQNLISDGNNVDLYFGKILKKLKQTNGKYLTTIKYNDITYSISTEYSGFSRYRDKDYNFYANAGGVVDKFDRCGKFLGRVVMPNDVTFSNEDEVSPEEEPTFFEHTAIGEPTFDVRGNVYAYERTPNKYSILKWTWVDSPDDPKGGPDAPADLKVAPATTGLSVTWTASPQDPGCVEGYEVERSSTSGGIFSNLTTTAPGVVSYSDTSILPGSSAFYRVRAKSSCGPSDYTAIIGGTRP